MSCLADFSCLGLGFFLLKHGKHGDETWGQTGSFLKFLFAPIKITGNVPSVPKFLSAHCPLFTTHWNHGDRRVVSSCLSSQESRIAGNVPSVPEFPEFRPRVSRVSPSFTRLSRPVWLIIFVIHFDWPKQMRERELGELPLAVFLGIHLSHHKRIGDFVLTDYCL